jgi:hypothetical protein
VQDLLDLLDRETASRDGLDITSRVVLVIPGDQVEVDQDGPRGCRATVEF